MSEIVIQARDVGKKYIIGHARQHARYQSLRDALSARARAACRKATDVLRGRPLVEGDELEELWALRGLDFDVNRGDLIGVIGRNGAGKSTLLKLLSQITEPTTGRIELRGRLASLLEVGTGFHPELTGRENIFLNGAVLGMSRAEIRRKFDEIVAFAEVEKFLDTPVKRYSSGMYVRLAFAVAAHLEPDILVVDEVLAVGDAQFQKKCLGKMRDVGGSGRTVLFVSHNAAALAQLCTKGLVLEAGRMAFFGSIHAALGRYLEGGEGTPSRWQRRPSSIRRAAITAIAVCPGRGQPSSQAPWSLPVGFTIDVQCVERIRGCQVAVRLSAEDGSAVFTTSNSDLGGEFSTLEPGSHRFRFEVPACFLSPGRYVALAALNIPHVETIDTAEDAVSFCIVADEKDRAIFKDGRRGLVTPILEWSDELA